MLSLTLFALFAVACAVLAPWLLPLAIVIVGPMDPTVHFASFDLAWTKLLVVVGTARLIYDFVSSKVPPTRFPTSVRAVLLAWGLFVVLNAASAFWASSKIEAVHEAVKYSEYLISAILAATYLQNRMRTSSYVIAGWGAVLGSVAMLQLLHGGYHNDLTGEAFHRATALFSGPNQAAGFLETSMACAFVLLAISENAVPYGLLALASVMGIAATASRGGMVSAASMAITTSVMLLKSQAKRSWAILGLCLLAFGFAAVTNHVRILHSLNIAHEVSATQRLDLWRAAYRMFTSHPVLGVGAGNYSLLYAKYGIHDSSYYLRTHANNLYLSTGAELGIVGLVLLVIFWSLVFRIGWVRFRNNPRDVTGLGLLLLTIGWSVHAFVDDLLFYPQVELSAFVALGLFMNGSIADELPLFISKTARVTLGILGMLTPVCGYLAYVTAQALTVSGLPGAMLFAEGAALVAPYDQGYQLAAGKAEYAGHRYDKAAVRLEKLSYILPEAGQIAGDARASMDQRRLADADWDPAIQRICSRRLDGWRYFEVEGFAAKRGRYKAAVFCINAALRQDPMQPEGYNRAARLALVLRRFGDAETYANIGLKLEPKSIPMQILRINALIGQRKFAVASQAVESVPPDFRGSLLASLGVGEYKADKVTVAKFHLDAAEKRSPLAGEPAFIRGLIYQAIGQSSVAEVMFKRRDAIVFINAAAQRELSNNEPRKALPLLIETANQIPNSAYLERVGNVLLYKLDKPREALYWLNRALMALDSPQNTAHISAELGDAYDSLGEWDAAATIFERSIKIQPDPVSLLHLGNAYLHINKPKKADEMLRRAFASATDSSISAAIVRIYEQANQPNMAAVYARKARKTF